ncbi:MAG: serine/threonine-protein kinase [Planctomycetota bacterium]
MNIGNIISIHDIHDYIIEDIKYGGMGEVYKLRKCHKNSEFVFTFKDVVAVKTYRDNLFNQQYRSAFEKELNTWILLDNNYIAPLQLIFNTNNKIMALMPWFEMNLSEYLNTIDKITLSDIKQIAISIAQALDYANKSLGIIHRDIKPENVLVSMHNNNSVRYHVSDWGISRINRADYLIHNGADIQNTMIGAGTPGYMSPERINGEENRINGDIFSIGIIIYKAIFKKLPYESSDVDVIKSDVITGKYFNLIISNTGKLNTKLATVIIKCLNPNANKRYLDYDNLIEDISKL